MSVPLAVVLVISVISVALTVTVVTGIRGWVETIRIRQGVDRNNTPQR